MKRVAWVVVITLWVFILASSLFTRVEADDYCYADVVQELGVLRSIPAWYESWSGRFPQIIVHGVFAAAEPFGARLGVPILLALFIAAWWYALASWYKRWDALFLCLTFGAALVMSRPNDEPIFWLAGLTSYWLPLVCAGLLVGTLHRRRTVLSALIAFFAVAFSETGGFLILFGLGLAFLFWKGERKRVMFVLACALTGYVIMAIAPGNAVRRASFIPVQLTPVYILRVAIAGFATNVILSFLYAALPGLFISGVGAIMPPPFPVRRLPLLVLILVLASSLVLALLAVLANGWGLGERAIYLLTPLWLAQWYLLGAIIGDRFRLWGWLAVAVGVVLIVFAGRHVIERVAYAQRWDARHAAILAGDRVPRDIGSWDTLTDTDWGLACAESWYGREIQFMDGENVP